MKAVPWDHLLKVAQEAQEKAWAPYSHFKVGAALLTEDGATFSGCNVENASYGLTICAERNAVGSMVVTGKNHRIVAVAIYVDADQPVPPCGACRQVLSEFGSAQTLVRTRTVRNAEKEMTMGELLPFAFSAGFLKKD